MRFTLLLPVFFIILSCATDADRQRQAAASQIKVILYEYPQCNYRLVGAITTDVERSENAAIQEAKEKASDVGAEYLSIMSMGKYALDRTSVSGKAFVCDRTAQQQQE